MRRGEIWWYERPDAKPRPMLVLTRPEAIPVLRDLLGVPATRTIRGIPSEVRLDERDGMPSECCLTLDNVQALRASLCTERITELSPERMREVCVALAAATGCSLA